MSKSALGRGLGALLGAPTAPRPAAHAAAVQNPFTQTSTSPLPAVPAQAVVPTDNRERVERVPLARIRPCPFQPRKDFSADSIRELADSIREQGIVQPLIVRARDGGYELIAGERRWRAAQTLNLAEAPVIVREADDRKVLEIALIENLQRENLNPIEEAQGYSQLIEQFALTQESVATQVGKSRAVVANALRLLRLPPDVQVHLRNGLLSVGHAKVILGLAGAAEQKLAAERVLKDALNVRQTEELVARLQQHAASIATKKAATGGAPTSRDIHVVDLENKLTERFGTKVSLRYVKGRGSVEIKFFNDDDLQRILQVAGVKMD